MQKIRYEVEEEKVGDETSYRVIRRNRINQGWQIAVYTAEGVAQAVAGLLNVLSDFEAD